MRKLAFIPAILVLLLLPACPSTDTNLNPISTTPVSATAEEAPDDIIITPGGYCYRANFHQLGVGNPWPSIESTTITLDDNDPASYLYYRSYIETKAGETRNNIFKVTTPVWDIQSVELYIGDVPTGIEIAESDRWYGPRAIASVLTIVIAKDTKSGEYTFEIYMEIDGEDYGSVPCTIKVIN
jgi:hypothetical protein